MRIRQILLVGIALTKSAIARRTLELKRVGGPQDDGDERGGSHKKPRRTFWYRVKDVFTPSPPSPPPSNNNAQREQQQMKKRAKEEESKCGFEWAVLLPGVKRIRSHDEVAEECNPARTQSKETTHSRSKKGSANHEMNVELSREKCSSEERT